MDIEPSRATEVPAENVPRHSEAAGAALLPCSITGFIVSVRPVSAHDLECRDDLGALQSAERERKHHNVEPWQGIRLLAHLKRLTVH